MILSYFLNSSKQKNSTFDINIPREGSSISLHNSFVLLEFEVTNNFNANAQYAYGIELCPVNNLGPVAFFSEAQLSRSSNEHLETFENLHTAILRHNLLSSSANTTDILHGFDSNVTRRREESTTNKQDDTKGILLQWNSMK